MAKKNVALMVLLAFILAPWAAQGQDGRLKDPSDLIFEPLEFSIPEPERIVLDNGLVIYLLEDRGLPLVSIEALIRAGQVYDQPDKVGVAKLTGEAMRSGGTKAMPPDEVNQKLEFMAAKVEVSIGIEHGKASLDVLKKDIDLGLKIFADILMAPAFDEEKFQVAKKREIENIKRTADNPERLVFRELRKSLYRGNPRGLVPTVDSVGRIERGDMVGFYSKHFAPDRIIMAVSGDFESKEMLDKLKAAFGSWERASAPLPPVPKPEPPKNNPVVLVPKELPQSTIAYGQLAPAKSDPDFFAMTVLNHILGGGGFRSKLMSEIRSKRGLAYAIGSFYRADIDYGVLAAMGQTKISTTAQTIDLMLDITNGFGTGKVSDEEIGWAKDSLINKFIFSFETAESVAWEYAMLDFYGLSGDFLKNYRDGISKVTGDDLLRAARKYIDAKNPVLVVVGKANALEKDLARLGPIKKVAAEEY